MEDTTPMLRQYLEIKKLYPGTLLLFRLGDFYELFNEDAIIGARELQITLTARHKDSKNPIPMCGVPHHAAASYIARLVRNGYRVAICEQSEPSVKGTKLVRREVVRVVTPGTAIDPQLIESKESVFLAAICASGDTIGAAFLDLSTGDFSSTQISESGAWTKMRELIDGYSPREILFPQSLGKAVKETFGTYTAHDLLSGHDPTVRSDGSNLNGSNQLLTPLEDDRFHLQDAEDALRLQFNTQELTGFGLDNKFDAIRAAGACLGYAHYTQKASADHISAIRYFESRDCMVLDSLTLKNLEVVQSRNESAKQRVLRNVIDETVTGMGGRLLNTWLLRPSIKRSEIETRLAAVSELTDSILREKLRFLMKEISDLERLVGRLNLGSATARDLIALGSSLAQTPKINTALANASSLLIQVLSENIFELPETCELISCSIVDEPPLILSDGGTIRPGFNEGLDELRLVLSNAKQTIAEFEEHERARTGIGNLKIRFNGVFGYYIEISKGNVARVPGDYERRQTLANAERYTTPQLKQWEEKVLGAEEKIIEIETRLFNEVRAAVRNETSNLQSTARAVATLDALASLAETATRRNYVRPIMHDGDEIEIKNSRHPVVEAYINDSFIPNDLYLNNSTDRMLIVTGANMGGKSTVLRQVALIQILAQIGSFVPASSARLPIIDRIWTRVGASDDLASGRSTFMVEMTETASILHNATPRSLVLLDEIGRGTSTFDGLSIAWAVAEYLHNSPQHSAKTIFATHYHELTELAENLPGAKNYQISATELDGEVVFLHKLQKGKATKSYGIAVARLAGLPQQVIERAKDVLTKLEKYELAVFAEEKSSGLGTAAVKKGAAQFSLFDLNNELALNEIRNADFGVMTPHDAVELIKEIQKKII